VNVDQIRICKGTVMACLKEDTKDTREKTHRIV
jgi:hypothetical protein